MEATHTLLGTVKQDISAVRQSCARYFHFRNQFGKVKNIYLAIDYALISGFVTPHNFKSRSPANQNGIENIRPIDGDMDRLGLEIFSLYTTYHHLSLFQFAITLATSVEFGLSMVRRSNAFISWAAELKRYKRLSESLMLAIGEKDNKFWNSSEIPPQSCTFLMRCLP